MKQTSLKENSHRELLFQEAVSGNLRMDLCARGVSVMTEPVPWDTHTHTLLYHTFLQKRTPHTDLHCCPVVSHTARFKLQCSLSVSLIHIKQEFIFFSFIASYVFMVVM